MWAAPPAGREPRGALDAGSRAVLEGRARAHVVAAEGFGWLRSLPGACADAVITDPPYSSGGQFRGDRVARVARKYLRRPQAEHSTFPGDNRDQRGFLAWCALWLAEALRVTKPGAVLVQFSDWRQLAVTIDAVQAGGWVWRGIGVWDKTVACRPQRGRFAAQAEYFVWASHGPLPLERGVPCLPGVFLHPSPRGERRHMTAKPEALMRDVVALCAPGGLVLDPFVGSGTTGVAALRTGRRFLGSELVTAYQALAAERLAAEERSAPIDSTPSQQTSFLDPATGAAKGAA
jgi:site-specific DNA-methyltransferase (adenine-specific)